MIQCLILEDEIAAQELMKQYIDKTPFIISLGTYESGLDVPPEILSQTDILFLDIQLPELNGISFLRSIKNPPVVIITTAFTNHAIEAFESEVLDYLVKPFSYERFFKAVTRARNELKVKQKLNNQQLFVYADKTMHKIEIKDILYIKAEIDYIHIVTKNIKILVLDSLQNWKSKLQDYAFDQVHRSYIINRDEIQKISGNQVFVSNTAIPIGRTHKKKFLSKIKQS